MSKLRIYRSERGLSQADFAKLVGVKKATISRIEKGRRTPSMGLVSRMVEVSSGVLTADDFMPPSPPAQPNHDRHDDQHAHGDDGTTADPVEVS